MIVGCKRPPALFDDLYDPLGKRCRLLSDSSEETARAITEAVVAAAEAAAEATSSGCEKRRGQDIVECAESADKRLRLSSSGQWVSTVQSSREEAEASSEAEKEASVRGWAESLVRLLKGCPSVEEATLHCIRVLTDFDAEVRQEALQEARHLQEQQSAPDELPSPEAMQALQHKNSVLLRAVHHLAHRCKNLEVGADEVASLRAELENSQEQVRRLVHSNEVLQGHLRVHLDQHNGSAMGWGPHALL
mmetsp:Transcript_28998/g.52809  ORF Transcript_28998/g.52809 Transcript_28998/m.52809 type:complete len:248 (-) Transcript_28998:54-797(-)